MWETDWVLTELSDYVTRKSVAEVDSFVFVEFIVCVAGSCCWKKFAMLGQSTVKLWKKEDWSVISW